LTVKCKYVKAVSEHAAGQLLGLQTVKGSKEGFLKLLADSELFVQNKWFDKTVKQTQSEIEKNIKNYS
jgi:hypothetical protein